MSSVPKKADKLNLSLSLALSSSLSPLALSLGSEPKQLDSPWLVKHVVGFSSPGGALIGLN